MATKRMFSKDVVRTDKFLDMSLSAQALYFHLCLDADVRGFVSPRSVMRMLGASSDDLNILIAKGFIVPFSEGVIIVTHWNVNNTIREDRESPSQYEHLLSGILLSDQGVYQLQDHSGSTPVELPPRLDKIRLDKIRLNNTVPVVNKVEEYINTFNELCGTKFQVTDKRRNMLRLRMKRFSYEQIVESTTNLSQSSFHMGANDRGWKADPDFLLRSDEQIDKFLNFQAPAPKNLVVGQEEDL